MIKTENSDVASRFDEIYSFTYKSVLAFITAKCKNTADISDILQDTYMELYQVLIKRGVNYITNESAFVLRIARQKIPRYYSLLEKLKNFVPMTSVNGEGEQTDFCDFEADTFLTEDFCVNHALIEIVRAFIETKPEEVQKIFNLMYDIELTIPEIAHALSLSESNVKSKLYRTLKEIRNILK